MMRFTLLITWATSGMFVTKYALKATKALALHLRLTSFVVAQYLHLLAQTVLHNTNGWGLRLSPYMKGVILMAIKRLVQGKVLEVNTGDVIQVKTGGKIVPNSGTQASAIVALTDNSTGTASDTIASISDAATKNAIASIAAKVNAINTAIKAVGITA